MWLLFESILKLVVKMYDVKPRQNYQKGKKEIFKWYANKKEKMTSYKMLR